METFRINIGRLIAFCALAFACFCLPRVSHAAQTQAIAYQDCQNEAAAFDPLPLGWHIDHACTLLTGEQVQNRGHP
jgi:hypothetical protein